MICKSIDTVYIHICTPLHYIVEQSVGLDFFLLTANKEKSFQMPELKNSCKQNSFSTLPIKSEKIYYKGSRI